MVKNILKVVFSGGILAWLIAQDKVNFDIIGQLTKTPHILLMAISFIILQNFSNSFRFLQIIKTQSTKHFPYFLILAINWIGLFFTTVLPGAVTGDLVKVFYLKSIDSEISKTSMILTALMDRIYGLIGLIILMGVISLFRYNHLSTLGPGVNNILFFNFILLSGVVVFFIVVFLPKNLQEKITSSTQKIPLIGKKMLHLNQCFWSLANHKKILFKCIGLSLISHQFGIFAFYILTSPFFGKELALLDIFTFIPMGMMVVAVPISPSGMGVGHAAFEKLFELFGVMGGANLFNTFWVVILCNNLIGIIPYLFLGKKTRQTPITPNQVENEKI